MQREIFVEDRILDNPGILGAAALARIDDERFLLQGHSCQSARHDPYAIRAGENEGPQIDMARRDAGIEKSRGCGERERWLSNEITGSRVEFRRENLAFGLRSMRPDKHAVAARAIDFLHDEFGEMFLDITQSAGLAATPCRHIVQNRGFAEIKFDNLRHIGIDRLVVGDAGADGIGDGHIARPVGAHQAGDADDRLRSERARIEETVVDPPVDDIDSFRALRGAHIDDIVLDEQVAALDEFDAKLIGQEGMLIIGRVEPAGRQHHDRWFARRCRGAMTARRRAGHLDNSRPARHDARRKGRARGAS